MSNVFSTEQLMFGKTGMSTPKNAFASIEGFDGDSDVLSAEMFEAEQELLSLEAYDAFSSMHNSAKITMIKKLRMNLDLFKCIKTAFSKEGLKSNIGFYLILFFIIISIICSIYFCAKGYDSFISHIYTLIDRKSVV